MQEITKRLHTKTLEGFLPVIEEMAKQGKTQEEIVAFYQSHLKAKTSQFYSKKDEPESIGNVFKRVLDKGKDDADSKAEKQFYNMLVSAGIPFQFQYKIGPYRADYLLFGYLVVELDGPHHNQERDGKRDSYLRKMGYRVLRIPLLVLITCPEAVIDEIKAISKIRSVKQ